jgi:hypothetical protein
MQAPPLLPLLPPKDPHLHLIATDGCFSNGGPFTKGPGPEAKELEELSKLMTTLKVYG